jgi:hypothetical protein
MAWTSPMTAVSGDLFTAAEYNLNVRDNFLELAAAINKDTTLNRGGLFSVEATNRIKQRFPGASSVLNEHRISICESDWREVQSFGPMVSVVTGSRALVCISAELMNLNNNAQSSASFEVTGATTIKASDNWRITHDGVDAQKWSRSGVWRLVTTLTPGKNTFRMKYRSGALGPVYFRRREIVVIPL